MKVSIPDKTSELTLAQFQHLQGDLTTDDQRGAYILKEFSKKDPNKFSPEQRASIYLTMMKLFEKDSETELKTEIEGYKLPSHLLNITVGHFIEIVNADPDKESLERSEIIMGCLYRKDWSKDFSEEEILETAYFFRDQPLTYTLFGMVKMAELIFTLQETFPLLYDQRINQEANIPETEDEGRKLYDMLQALAGGKFIDWKASKNRLLKDAFVYLEEIKKQRIKEKLNEKKN